MASLDPDRPNILLVTSDDQGPWALGCAGNTEIRTPVLDGLAGRGVRFDRFFCTSPVCSPARASLFTGLIPSQHGVHDWIRGDANAGPRRVDFLGDRATLFGELAAGGYLCGISGKWHLGRSDDPHPAFAHWYVHESGGGPYYGTTMYRGTEPETEDRYLTDRITDDALGFLAARDGEEAPFFLNVNYTAPHSPWIDAHPREFLDLYADCAFESCPEESEHPWQAATVPSGSRKRRLEALRGYFAAVTAMDTAIGRILTALEEAGLRESTIVWFLSDNGFNCGHHGVWGKGNGTFPQNMYDSSVMVPAIVSQPGRCPEGVVSSALVSGYDLAPTVLEQAGLPVPERMAAASPGRSFAPLLRDPHGAGAGAGTGAERVVVFDEYGPVRMIRTEDWKYVHRYPHGPHELYHLAEDPGERTDLSRDPAHAKTLRALRGDLARWFERYVDPALDGSRQPAAGTGQLGRIDTACDEDLFFPPR